MGIMLGVMRDYVSRLLMKGASLIVLPFIFVSGSILIIEQY
jgi:hypothetical protein